MAWTIRWAEDATKQLGKFDKPVAVRITKFLKERVATQSDPRGLGAPLTGSRYGELWKYRVGDYRIVARIEDDIVQILVVKIGHRKDVYHR